MVMNQMVSGIGDPMNSRICVESEHPIYLIGFTSKSYVTGFGYVIVFCHHTVRQISLGQPLFRQENGRQIPNGRGGPSSA
jgi:hypothetical protein